MTSVSSPVPAPLVVVVNDDPTQLAILCAMIRREAVRVLPFDSVRAALAAMERESPSVVVTDLCMPEIDGWSFCRLLRSSEYPDFNHTPILVVSAIFSGASTAEIASELGASDFLALPVEASQLRERVRRLVGRPQPPPARNLLLFMAPGPEVESLYPVFGEQGYAASVVSDASGVESALRVAAWDVVVWDLALPGFDLAGVSACSTNYPNTALVVITEDTDPALASASLRAGACAHLRRPFSPDYLFGLCELARRKMMLLRVQALLESRTQELHQSERKLHAVIDTSDQVYLLLDSVGRVELANQAAVQMAGEFCDGKLREGENAIAILPPQIAARAVANLAVAFTGQALSHELVLADRAGRLRCFGVSYTPITGPDGAIQHVCFNARDITARRETENQLRRSQTRLQALFDNSHDAILLADDEGRHVDANPAACRMLGYTRDELLAVTVSDLFGSADGSWAASAWREFIRDGARHGECGLVRKDGSVLRGDYSAIAGILPGLHLTILRDLTEKHALQSRLLRQQRLESVGRLASGVAHDLNNILTPILMAPAMLRPHVADAGARMLLETLENAARRGSTVVRQLLAFARCEPGEKIRIDLSAVLQGARAIIQETFPKRLVLDFTHVVGGFPVLGDGTQLQQVIINLALNGADSMPRGGRLVFGLDRVDISPEEARPDPEVRPGRHVVLTVADHGHGIAPEHIEQIFDPFFTTKPFGQGSGLGLSVVLGIVRGHGGFLRVSSRVGVGTLVKVYLPLQSADAPPVAGSTPPVEAAKLSVVQGHGRSVLVVDDEADVREIVRMILARAGYRVMCADGADAAFSQLRSHGDRVDLIITDLSMPGLAGPQFIERLRHLRAETPILVMSGTEFGGVLGADVRSASIGTLVKPFDTGTLLDAVERALPTATAEAPRGTDSEARTR